MLQGFELRVHGVEVVDQLRELYQQLHLHQAAVAPQILGCPPRSADEVWDLRRAHYHEWLRHPAAAVIGAHVGEPWVGYALVTTAGGYDGWATQSQIGEVKDIVVSDSARGRGVGSALMAGARHHLQDHAIDGLRLNVIAGNDLAMAFYRSLGMTVAATTLTCPTTP